MQVGVFAICEQHRSLERAGVRPRFRGEFWVVTKLAPSSRVPKVGSCECQSVVIDDVAVLLTNGCPWALSVAVVEARLFRVVEPDNQAGTLASLLNDAACQSIEKIRSHNWSPPNQIILRPKASHASYASFRTVCSKAYVVDARWLLSGVARSLSMEAQRTSHCRTTRAHCGDNTAARHCSARAVGIASIIFLQRSR